MSCMESLIFCIFLLLYRFQSPVPTFVLKVLLQVTLECVGTCIALHLLTNSFREMP